VTASDACPHDRAFELRVLADASEVATAVADLVVELVRASPHAVLGLPTGSTPLPLYRELVGRAGRGEVSFSDVTVFLLDEYVSLADGHPRSFLATIRREFTDAAGFGPDQVHGPNPRGDLERAAASYDDAIREAGGVDLQLLGIGRNGHIGFNEPGTPFEATTRVADLSSVTRADAAEPFGTDDVPTRAITQGPATIMSARRAVLMATGTTKAAAVAAMLDGPIDPACPASLLRRHRRATAYVDAAAASALEAGRPVVPQGRRSS